MPVDDDEILFRQVPNVTSHFSYADGRLRLSSSAFNDSSCQPSVERARLNDNEPARTKKNPTDGVVSLVTGEVRGIADVVQNDARGQFEFRYKVDVEPAPLEGNPAHALIVTDPTFRAKSTFRKLKESLARLASGRGWTIEPS